MRPFWRSFISGFVYVWKRIFFPLFPLSPVQFFSLVYWFVLYRYFLDRVIYVILEKFEIENVLVFSWDCTWVLSFLFLFCSIYLVLDILRNLQNLRNEGNVGIMEILPYKRLIYFLRKVWHIHSYFPRSLSLFMAVSRLGLVISSLTFGPYVGLVEMHYRRRNLRTAVWILFLIGLISSVSHLAYLLSFDNCEDIHSCDLTPRGWNIVIAVRNVCSLDKMPGENPSWKMPH